MTISVAGTPPVCLTRETTLLPGMSEAAPLGGSSISLDRPELFLHSPPSSQCGRGAASSIQPAPRFRTRNLHFLSTR